MKFLRNLIKTLLSLLFLVNLYISFDQSISQESLTTEYDIELRLRPYGNDIRDFNLFKISFSHHKSVVSYEKDKNFDNLIINQNSLEHLKFNIQNNEVLVFKLILLQNLISEISIIKSHCI